MFKLKIKIETFVLTPNFNFNWIPNNKNYNRNSKKIISIDFLNILINIIKRKLCNIESQPISDWFEYNNFIAICYFKIGNWTDLSTWLALFF